MSKGQDLCDDPVIHAADRLKNETYRIYRGNHYWELIGLPPKEKSAQVRGPFLLPYPKMLTFEKRCLSSQTLDGKEKNGMGLPFKCLESLPELEGTCGSPTTPYH